MNMDTVKRFDQTRDILKQQGSMCIVKAQKYPDRSKLGMRTIYWDFQNHFARWYIMFGDYAKIIEPQELKNRVLQLLEEQEQQLTT